MTALVAGDERDHINCWYLIMERLMADGLPLMSPGLSRSRPPAALWRRTSGFWLVLIREHPLQWVTLCVCVCFRWRAGGHAQVHLQPRSQQVTCYPLLFLPSSSSDLSARDACWGWTSSSVAFLPVLTSSGFDLVAFSESSSWFHPSFNLFITYSLS